MMFRYLNMNTLSRLCLVCMALFMASCASSSSSAQLKPATVIKVERGYRSKDINYIRPTLNAARLGYIGSQVGRGTAAHIVGAAVGVLAGGGLSYMSEKHDARGAYTSVTLKLDDDSKATVGATKVKPMPIPGQRVWVKCDSAGVPYQIVPSKEEPKKASGS
jgi:outer membrane lipoprotein SlyB